MLPVHSGCQATVLLTCTHCPHVDVVHLPSLPLGPAGLFGGGAVASSAAAVAGAARWLPEVAAGETFVSGGLGRGG